MKVRTGCTSAFSSSMLVACGRRDEKKYGRRDRYNKDNHRISANFMVHIRQDDTCFSTFHCSAGTIFLKIVCSPLEQFIIYDISTRENISNNCWWQRSCTMSQILWWCLVILSPLSLAEYANSYSFGYLTFALQETYDFQFSSHLYDYVAPKISILTSSTSVIITMYQKHNVRPLELSTP
jgi:hypothetical protein